MTHNFETPCITLAKINPAVFEPTNYRFSIEEVIMDILMKLLCINIDYLRTDFFEHLRI
jgi:hypothetical protein